MNEPKPRGGELVPAEHCSELAERLHGRVRPPVVRSGLCAGQRAEVSRPPVRQDDWKNRIRTR